MVGSRSAVPHPVFVLSRYPRNSITMEGGTSFHFIPDGIYAALKYASEAAAGKDVLLGGGVSSIQQYLRAGLIDEMHLAIAPILLGSGEHLFAGIDLPTLGYQNTFPPRGSRMLRSRKRRYDFLPAEEPLCGLGKVLAVRSLYQRYDCDEAEYLSIHPKCFQFDEDPRQCRNPKGTGDRSWGVASLFQTIQPRSPGMVGVCRGARPLPYSLT